MLFVIAPSREFSSKEILVLKDYMEKGGKIIWSVGWEEMEASRSFLKEFNLEIDSIPLGPAEVQIGNIKAQFVEAWPVTGGDSSKQVFVEKWGYPIVLFQPVGKGGVLIIGDSQFLLSKNIESYKQHNLNNIRFVWYMINYWLK